MTNFFYDLCKSNHFGFAASREVWESSLTVAHESLYSNGSLIPHKQITCNSVK